MLMGSALTLGCAGKSPAPTEPPPQAVAADQTELDITASGIKATLYLPHPTRGHYRALRFDGSGMVGRVVVNGHTFFGPWDAQVPGDANHDAGAIGTADEYGIDQPAGYAQAALGGSFVKIGVGRLTRTAPTPYRFSFNYPVVDAPAWKMQHGTGYVDFQQTLEPVDGWGYDYHKRVELLAGSKSSLPALLIHRTLMNIGQHTLETEQYTHNFVMIDDDLVDPRYALDMTFPITLKRPKDLNVYAEATGRRIQFLKPLPFKASAYADVANVPDAPAANHAVVTNSDSRASITISGDRAPVAIKMYATPRVICPEIFVPVRIEAGKTMSWTTRYEFSAPTK